MSDFAIFEDEPVLIKELAVGNESAYEYIFMSFYDPLCLYANKIVHDLDMAEDLVHNSLCNLWIKRNDLTIKTSVKSYLYRSVCNACLNHIKARKTENEFFQEKYYEYISKDILLSPHKEMEIMTKELGEQISSAIDSLPEKCRIIFELSRISGLKMREIAEELDISINTVQTQLAIALKKLRNGLGDKGLLLFLISIRKNKGVC